MQRKNPSKGKSAGFSRIEKIVLPAQATNYRGPVTRRQGLRSSKIEVELATELAKGDAPHADCVSCEEELIDGPGDAQVNANDGVSRSVCENQEEEGNSSFITAAEAEPGLAAPSSIQDEEWEEIVRRAKEREAEELAEEEEECQRREKGEEKVRLKHEKEEKVRQQVTKNDEKSRAKQEKIEERTLKKKQQEKEARKEEELVAQEVARRQECRDQKRREEVHAALVKSHQKITEEMAEKAEATIRKKKQIAADMAIDLRRRLDLARGLAGSSSG